MQQVVWSRLTLNLLRETSVVGFRNNALFFTKNAVLNTCRYLKRFYTYKKINDILLKGHHFFIKDSENRRNLLNLSCKDKGHAYAGE